METEHVRALAPLSHEVALLSNLSHPNVVNIVGFVEDIDNGAAWMVFSWEKNGNLREFVRSANWELPERVSLIDDVAKGLTYLHGRNPPICHGDLKSLNILINSENRAVITDFGSARAVDCSSASEAVVNSVNATKVAKIEHRTLKGEPKTKPLKAEIAESGEFITMTGPAWTVRWAAPELLEGVLPGLGSDVWAFGWICWEAVTGNFPFHEENDIAIIRRIVTRDLPTVSNDAQLKQVKMLCSLMEECLRLAANERPSAFQCQQVVSWMNRAVPLRRGGESLVISRSSGLLYALGRIQLHNDAISKAQEYFRQSLEVSKSVGDDNGKARALNAIGEALLLQHEYSEAAERHTQARDLYYKNGDYLGIAQSVYGLGEVYRMRSEYSKAGESYTQARDIYFKIGDQLGIAQSVNALGDVFRMRNEDSKAQELYTQSRDLYAQIGSQLGFAQSVKALGDVYRMRNEYSKAEELYTEARDVYGKIGDRLGFAQSVKALGDLHRARNAYSKAVESYIQSRDLYSEIRSHLGLAQSVYSLGEVYRMRNQYSEAEESYTQARDLYSKIGSHLGFAQSLQGMGRVHSARKEYAKAGESYVEAQKIYQRLGDTRSSAKIAWYLGWLRRNQGQYGEAERLVREASTVYGELGLKKRVADCNKFLTEIHQFKPSVDRKYQILWRAP